MKTFNLYKSKQYFTSESTYSLGCIGVFEKLNEAIDFVKRDSNERYGVKPYRIRDDYYSVQDPLNKNIIYFYEIHEKEDDLHPNAD